MTWLPWRRSNEPDSDALNQDRAARVEAEDRLAETARRWPEVHRLADELRQHRQANRFSERIMNAIRSEETDT